MPAIHLVLTLLLLGCGGADKAASEKGDTGDTGSTAAEDALVREPEVCAAPAVDLTETSAGFLATTEHYSLSIEGFDEEEAARLAALAETAHEGLADFFGLAVDGPLQVFVAADEAGLNALLAADGLGGLEGAGGYYDPGNERAYLYRQPTAYYSRVLLLHEIVHQYQDHVSGISGLPTWLVEGAAEALSRHHWDGSCLELRVRPLLSWEDAAASAQAELDGGLDLGAILAGGTVSRPVGQELFRLLSSDPELAPGLDAWLDELGAGGSPTDLERFAALIAPVDQVAEALEDWVPQDQEPMTPVWLDWVPQGEDEAWGFASGSSSAARVKEAASVFRMKVAAPSGGASVGTVYGYDPDTGELELAFVSAGGAVSRFAVLSGGVSWDVLGSVTAEGTLSWSQTAAEGSTTVEIGGEAVALPRTLPAAGGLALYDADAVFSGIGWE